MNEKTNNAGAWRRWGLGLLAIYAGLALLGLARVLIIQAGWSDLTAWLIWSSPLGVIGAALIIAGSIRTANHRLTASLACFWTYIVSLPVWLIIDYGRPPPGSFDSYGLVFLVALMAMVPLMGLASICWFVGYLETDLPRGRQLGWQLLAAGGLGLGAGLAITAIWLNWETISGRELGAQDKDWRLVVVAIALALVAGCLATWLIGRIQPSVKPPK